VKTKDYMLFWVPAALSIAATPVLLSFAWTDYKKLKEQQNTPEKP